ncbi:Uncharacterised protein [Collinsella intestinalis]|nr:Uncharacterised protein [Collinsella intestinalis]
MHVRMGAAGNTAAVITGGAGTRDAIFAAQKRLGQRPSGIELAGTRRAEEQIGVARTAARHRTSEEVAHTRLRIELDEEAVGGEAVGHG